MAENRDGQVVTFYSYKGGTGRTMALANVAWILAENGKRVLVADWDLESPGLHRFFNPFLDPNLLRNTDTGGIIDMIRAFDAQAAKDKPRPADWATEFAKVERFAFPLTYTFASGGSLDFLSAGRQNQDYSAGVSGLDWDMFYDRLGGAALFDALRADMKRNYDYALIDSRTGLSDVANICTIHLPDVLVDCFTFSEQGIDGASMVAREVAGTYATRKIRVLPVPMRVDPAEKDKADAGRTLAMYRFAGLPAGLTDQDRQKYWSDVEVPYHAYYAYEETLATFGDRPNANGTLLSAYENLTSAITFQQVTAMPALEDGLRTRWRARFERKHFVPRELIVLRYVMKDQLWAEWIERVLTSAGVQVHDPLVSDEAGRSREDLPSRILTIASSGYAESPPDSFRTPEVVGSELPPAVYVDDVRLLPEFPVESSEFIDGLSAKDAAARVLQLVGRGAVPGADPQLSAGARYPGDGPVLQNPPVANVQFTGRDTDLRQLRRLLRDSTGSGPSLVVLYGMPGVGKTQIALEYVHRFRAAYDLVWWIGADPSLFIDSALADLASRMGLSEQSGSVPANTRAVLDVLGKGQTYPRWLLVFDNAEDFDEIKAFLPQGRGHVLITSRNQAWGESARSIEVNVFRREESIEQLRRRFPSISDEDAERVAEALGDLPIALAVGGALLAASGTTVDEYLEQIAEGGASLESNWDLSLSRLADESPAAYRLLELCSVLAPGIAIDLLTSNGFGELVRQHDPSARGRSSIHMLIQRINRLALLKLDTRAQQIQVHRLLQSEVRGRMSPDQMVATRHEVVRALAAARPETEVDEPVSWDRYRILWPHLEFSDATMQAALDSEDPAVLDMLVERVRYVWLRGSLEQSGKLAERINEAWTARIEEATDPQRYAWIRPIQLRLRFNFGNILRDQGRYQHALEMDEATLEEQRQLLGATHTDTLMTAGGVAADLRAIGHYGQALDRDKVTSAAWAQEFGEDYPRTLAALNNLASSMRLTGQFAEAMRLDERVLERRRVLFGRSNLWTLRSAGNMARDLREAGEYERSIALLREVLASYQSMRVPNVVAMSNAQTNLSVSLRCAGQTKEALQLLDSIYDTLRQNLGKDSPDALVCRLSRATNLLALGKPEAADTELQAVQRAYTELLGSHHPHTLVCVNNLAAVARARNDQARALEYADAAVRGLKDSLHPRHSSFLAARMNLAVCRAEADDWAGGLALTEQLWETMHEVLGATHPDTLRCEANLVLLRLPRDSQPVGQLLDLTNLAGALGPDHPDLATLRDGRLLDRVLDPHPF